MLRSLCFIAHPESAYNNEDCTHLQQEQRVGQAKDLQGGLIGKAHGNGYCSIEGS